MKISPNTFPTPKGQGGDMNKDSVLSMAKLSDAVNDMCDLYLSLIRDACKKCPTKKLAMLRVSKSVIAEKVQELGIPNPMLKHHRTRKVALLSDWICDYLELTPEEWGGDYFADAGLIEVHTVNGENH